MGTDLYAIGNHAIQFKGKPFEEIISDIKAKLDSIAFVNAEFLHNFAIAWHRRYSNMKPEEISVKRDWQYLPYYDPVPDDLYAEFKGPFELTLRFENDKVNFDDPAYRYAQWFKLQNEDGSPATEHRNAWRLYMYQVLQAIGGDRVMYLADNAHLLEKYLCMEDAFYIVEARLKNDLGAPKKSFEDVVCEQDYMIDTFDDIKPG